MLYNANMKYVVLLYYKYVEIKDPAKLMDEQKKLCVRLGLKGRILIATEGINGTVEGTKSNVQQYIKEVKKDKRFAGINWKKSEGTGSAFKKLKVKVRPEIVTTGIPNKDFGPLIYAANGEKVAGKHLSADELKKWYEEGREFYVVDMRNDYEFEVGRFKNSVWPKGLGHFRDVPKAIKSISNLKDKTVVTVCTGGVRCETASGLLLKHGFKDVYQLQNGIVTFMENYPNTFFEGKLLVFDGRETIAFNTDSPEHKIVGKCRVCGTPSENLVNYFNNGKNTYGIICVDCCNSNKVNLERKPTSDIISP
ncbi:MAG: rhodanese-related sulfurtransferase [Patescibacteria group bacterium]